MQNIKYLLIHLMRLLTISLTLSRSNGILPGIIWGIHWSIIVLTYIVYRKDSHLEDNGYLFNKTNVSYNQNNHLGSVSIRPTPGYRNELHETRLPDEWGKKWFNLMLEDDECMESQDRFRAFFKGIAFIPDENGTCINGFQVNDSSFCITLYYHELKEKPTEQTLVFNASTSLNYTKVEHDRTDTPLENLTEPEQIMNLPFFRERTSGVSARADRYVYQCRISLSE